MHFISSTTAASSSVVAGASVPTSMPSLSSLGQSSANLLNMDDNDNDIGASPTTSSTPAAAAAGAAGSSPTGTVMAPGSSGGVKVKKKKVVVKVGMVGDSQIGKTSLMVKYVEGNYNEDYIQTLGMATHVDWRSPTRLTELVL
jgi:hypothetical protein